MILTAQEIRAMCEGDKPLISPFKERHVHAVTGMSGGLTGHGYDVHLDQNVIIGGNDPLMHLENNCQLANTVEHFNLPHDIVAYIFPKSTMARQFTVPIFTPLEAGWSGWLTLELVKYGLGAERLDRGQPIGQIQFFRSMVDTDQPYAGKYQDQPRKPVPALRESA